MFLFFFGAIVGGVCAIALLGSLIWYAGFEHGKTLGQKSKPYDLLTRRSVERRGSGEDQVR
jgi:hypothetical protein